jgi:hypothetical protein
VPLLERACKGKIAFGCATLGRIYQDNYSPRIVAADPGRADCFNKRALELFMADCERNDGDACLEAAQLYWVGRGVLRNNSKRWHYTGRACENGNAYACAQIGESLWQGAPGLELDFPRAAKMLIRACELDYQDACRQAPQVVVDHVILHPPGTPWKDAKILETLLSMSERELATGPRRPERFHASIGSVRLLQGKPKAALAAFQAGLRVVEAKKGSTSGARAPYVFGIALAQDALDSAAASTEYQRFVELAARKHSKPHIMLPRAQGITPKAAMRYARERMAALVTQ